MATGFTGPIADGTDTSMANYLWRLAGFPYRDPPVVPPVEYIVAEHEASMASTRASMEAAEVRLEELAGLSDDALEAAERRRAAESWQFHQEVAEKRRTIRDRYMKLRAKLEAWVPPSDDHEGLKTQAITHLDESIAHDCGEVVAADYMYTPKSADDARTERREHLNREISMYKQQLIDDQAAHERRVAWIRALEKSVPRPR